MWNAIPDDIKSSMTLITFKQKLRNLYFERLRMVFDQDNIRTYKLICVKCRSINTLTSCIHVNSFSAGSFVSHFESIFLM
jgi:hypothetical protein